MSTLAKGKITELQVLQFFLSEGYIVSTPEIPYQYDFLLDIGPQILKIQVKTCREINDGDCIEFNTSSVTHNSKGYKMRKYSAATVDYFCTYYKDNCYLIPFEECGIRRKILRLTSTKNGQTKNISFAEKYLAKEVLKQYISKSE